MDDGSKEELRVYSIVKELGKKEGPYHEKELQEIFSFKKQPLRYTRLYKYLKPVMNPTFEPLFEILQGDLVTGDDVEGRSPVMRGKYRITTVIDGVRFVYVEIGENNG